MVFAELYKKNHELRVKEEETKKLNSAIIAANTELAAQYAEIEKQAKDLQIKNKELDAFTYISSHDLQEPLRKIQTFANLILSSEYENLSENGRQKFKRILYSANRMRQLIHSLLAFSRTNITDRQFERVDLNVIIEDLRDALSENIQEKDAVIETELEGTVNVIPFQFTQLLQNLISNAIKFAMPDITPTIKIKSSIVSGAQLEYEKLSKNSNYCHIIVQDNGIGFDPKFSEKIFDVFQKLHDRDTYEGTGIGLAIVKKIVENHNGLIIATGEPSNGARFDIFIPDTQGDPTILALSN
jgi:light-regulated signal transduction histidine kinase (bacteriophytochrome)